MKRILPLLCLMFFVNFLFAQDGVVVYDSLADAEFHVAINPIDTNNIIVATMHGEKVSDDLRIYYTYDQGTTWQTSTFRGLHPGFETAGDPVLDFDASGNAYLVNITSPVGFQIVLSKSTDGGATWQLGTNIFRISIDKPWLGIDRSASSPYKDNIYIPGVNYISTANLPPGPILLTYDQNFNQTSQVSAGTTVEHLPAIAIRKDGEVFMSMVDRTNPNQIFVAQYTNGGTTLVHKTFLTSFPDFEYNAPDISERFQATVYIAIDNSGGPYDGRLYVAYTASEQVTPSIFDVFLMYSDDGGQTWSAPKAVHSSVPEGTNQFYSSIFVNDQGVLLIDWYDRRNYAPSSLNTDFFLGISYDGGGTFTEIQLNSQSMDFQYTIPSGSGFGIGEYHQLVATDHTAISFWADGRTNDENLNIYMAKVSLNDPVLSIKELGFINEHISVSAPYPVPVAEEVFMDVTLDQPHRLQTVVMDIKGQELWASEWQDYSAGDNQLKVPFNEVSGIYVIQVKSETGFFKSFKVHKK